jgi:hypothetical protein
VREGRVGGRQTVREVHVKLDVDVAIDILDLYATFGALSDTYNPQITTTGGRREWATPVCRMEGPHRQGAKSRKREEYKDKE